MTDLLSPPITPISQLNLKRALYGKKDPENLQAFDSADEYILQALLERKIGPVSTVLIFNDTFGALTTALHSFKPYHISDSLVSQKSTQQNLALNGLECSEVTFLDSLSMLPDAPHLIVMKVPKSLAYLADQIAQLKEIITQETVIIAGAKAKDIHTSTLNLFDQLGVTKTSLAWKKSRLVYCEPRRQSCLPLMEKSAESLSVLKHPLRQLRTPSVESWYLDDGSLISNYANVFSKGQLDIGARFFLEHVPSNREGIIVDLGCGNGVIGLRALKNNPNARVMFVDESYMAIESSRLNVLQNRPQDLERCEFILSDALTDFPENTVSCVLCNPPFHQQNTITDDIAKRMFQNAKKSMLKGAELVIIGNRHLGYYHSLKMLFSHVETLASNNKFVILRSVKP